MRIISYGLTDVGLKRKSNQDSILVDSESHLYAVADGMGGHKGGEVASKIALEESLIVARGFSLMEPFSLMEKIFETSCQKVFDESQKDSSLQGMGTTLVLALIRNDKIYIGNVGDSRAYLFREGSLWQLTEDHSFVNDQIKSGVIDEEEDLVEGRNIITRSIGYESKVKVDIIEKSLEVGDFYLLSSDGLHGLVSHIEIERLCKESNFDQWPELLIKKAKTNGGDDNISVVAVRITGE